MIELPEAKDCGLYQVTQDVQKRQSTDKMPTSQEIAEVAHKVICERYGPEVAHAVCMASEDCLRLIAEYDHLIQDRNSLVAMNGRFAEVERRLTAIDGVLSGICRYIPQMTDIRIRPATPSKITKMCEDAAKAMCDAPMRSLHEEKQWRWWKFWA